MVDQNPVKCQVPYGLLFVLTLFFGCGCYLAVQANSSDDDDQQSVAAAPSSAEQHLFNGVYNDDPKLIRDAVATYGTLPADIAGIAINLAASEKHQRALSELLIAGAPLDGDSIQGRTPLITAAGVSGNSTVVESLLAAGADPNATSCDGTTPMSEARRIGDQESIKALEAAKTGTHCGMPPD